MSGAVSHRSTGGGMPELTCPTCHTALGQHRAGPCLDAWVASVMGCLVVHAQVGGTTRFECGCHGEPHGGRHRRLKGFSADEGAAALLRNALVAQGWQVSLIVAPNREALVRLSWTRHTTLADDARALNDHPQAPGATGPLALAKVAIIAASYKDSQNETME